MHSRRSLCSSFGARRVLPAEKSRQARAFLSACEQPAGPHGCPRVLQNPQTWTRMPALLPHFGGVRHWGHLPRAFPPHSRGVLSLGHKLWDWRAGGGKGGVSAWERRHLGARGGSAGSSAGRVWGGEPGVHLRGRAPRCPPLVPLALMCSCKGPSPPTVTPEDSSFPPLSSQQAMYVPERACQGL